MEKLAEKVVFPVFFLTSFCPFFTPLFKRVQTCFAHGGGAPTKSLSGFLCVVFVVCSCSRLCGRESITFEYYSRDEWVKGPNLGFLEAPKWRLLGHSFRF